ncbi:MAG TPA: class I tRNA ligase family protein, partial [Candidatus Binatia bacterium]|nr:class I tRNA ligase family protein [Candidatus Binatia bacterium]
LGVEGAYRFLNRLWRFVHQHHAWLAASKIRQEENQEHGVLNGDPRGGAGASTPQARSQEIEDVRNLRRAIHRTIKKVTDDIEDRFHFNTAVAAIMELFNALAAAAQEREKLEASAPVIREGIEALIVLLAPFVPHVANELWEQLGHAEPLERVPWPGYSEAALEEEKLLIVVQVNGRVRAKITVPAGQPREQIETEALNDPKVKAFLDGKRIEKLVYVPGRLINIVAGGS